MPDLLNLTNEWDVLVAGAGPAGSAAAICCARRGLKVLLVDAKPFPRRKVCGGCLNRVSVELLRELVGRDCSLWTTARRLDSFELRHRQRHFRFAMPEGFAVERAAMDQSLTEVAAASGAEFLPAVSARVASVDARGRDVQLSSGSVTRGVSAKVVILATGLGNRSATDLADLRQAARGNSRVGIEGLFNNFPPQYSSAAIHMAVARAGYVGLTQIAGGRLHVAAAVDRHALQQLGPAQLTSAILKEAGAPQLFFDEEVMWRGTPPLTVRAKRLAAERIFLIGDAAGYIEPFTGEGIRWALETGIGVAHYAVQACARWQPAMVDQWESWYRRRISREQRLCRQITSGLKHASLRWFAHQALSLHPRLASTIITRLNT